MPDKDVLIMFSDLLKLLMGKGGRFSYFWCKSGDHKQTIWFDRNEHSLPFSKIPADHDVYFGLYPSYQSKGEKERTSDQDIAYFTGFFADFDAKDKPKEQIKAHIDGLEFKPTCLIDSGGGYHAYWLFQSSQSMFINPGTEYHQTRIKAVKRLIRGWVAIVGGDSCASLLTQGPRVPGYRNWKYPDDERIVSFVEFDPTRLYDFTPLQLKIEAYWKPIEAEQEAERQRRQQEAVAFAQTIKAGEPSQETYRRYCLQGVQKECDGVASAQPLTRNDTLNRSAFKIGQLVATGYVTETEARAQLENAATLCNLTSDDGQKSVDATITSGLRDGQTQPRDLSHIQAVLPKSPQPETVTPVTPLDDEIVDFRQIGKAVKQELNSRTVPVSEPVFGFITDIRRFGGFARYHWTRKMVLIVGATGMGKTSLVQDIVEESMRRGIDTLLWCSEWVGHEWAYRHLIRSSDVDFDSLCDHQVKLYEDLRGIPTDQCKGKELTAAQVASGCVTIDNLMALPGNVYMPKRQGRLSLDELLDIFARVTVARRAEGRDVKLALFDYIQLVKDATTSRTWEYLNLASHKIKVFCEEYNLLGIVTCQARKADDDAVREGELLSQGAARGVSGDPFNLILTLNPVFQDGNRLEKAIIRVTKNNLGQVGHVQVDTNLKRLTWF